MLRKVFLYEIESICVAFLPIIWLNRYYIYLKGEKWNIILLFYHLWLSLQSRFSFPLLQRFKLKALPVVVAEIIAGIFVGKSGFNIIEPDIWLQVLSTLGFIFLMFLSGLEIDFSIFKQKGKKYDKRTKYISGSKHYLLIYFHLILCPIITIRMARIRR